MTPVVLSPGAGDPVESRRYAATRQACFPRVQVDWAGDEGTVIALAIDGEFVAGASVALLAHALDMDDLAARWAPTPGPSPLHVPTARIHRLWTAGGPGLLRALFVAMSRVFPQDAQAICGVVALPADTPIPPHLGLVAPREAGATPFAVRDLQPTSDGPRLLKSYVRWGARPLGPPAVDPATGVTRALLWAERGAIPSWLRPVAP